MANNSFDGRFERWQYRIFQAVLFVIFLYYSYKFLESHVPVKEFVASLWRR